MKQHLIIFSTQLLLLFGCLSQKTENQNINDSEKTIEAVEVEIVHDFPLTKDSLISELANMETDTLDCIADIYWQIIGKGKQYIPNLIESLTDTTPTNIYHGYKNGKLNIGELSYFALEEIGDFPAFVVTQIQFDIIEIKDGWHC